jgi:hypothetical protein
MCLQVPTSLRTGCAVSAGPGCRSAARAGGAPGECTRIRTFRDHVPPLVAFLTLLGAELTPAVLGRPLELGTEKVGTADLIPNGIIVR